MIDRRRFVRSSVGLAAGLSVRGSVGRLWAARSADGTYQNPILPGDRPDASPLRVGEDFYLTCSSLDFGPGLLIWHSRDLINWKPVVAALRKYAGPVWAPYLCEYQGTYYIYYPCDGRLQVVTAPHPTGPWSDPVELGLHAIDPCHVAEDGRRYLYVAGGQIAELSADGLSIKTPLKDCISPWKIPSSFRIECTCLEAPKIAKRGEYFYLTVAEGGTSGPSTSHMVVAARSRHATGPWEFDPHNPVVHTYSRTEHWHSVGHGRLVDTPQGRWYMTVHGYENGYHSLGRQILLLPIEWTSDGWFKVSDGVHADSALPMPIPGTKQEAPLDPSDDFRSPKLGLQWGFWREYDETRFQTGNGELVLQARGESLGKTPVMATPVGARSYTIEVDVEIDEGCEAGLVLFYNPNHAAGISVGPRGIVARSGSGGETGEGHARPSRVTLRIVNDDQEVDFYFMLPGGEWTKHASSTEVSGMAQNVLAGFYDLRPAIYSCGSGKAVFRNFRYRAGV